MEIQISEQLDNAKRRVTRAFNSIFPIFMEKAEAQIYGYALYVNDHDRMEGYKIILVNVNGLPESSKGILNPIEELDPETIVHILLLEEEYNSEIERPQATLFANFTTNAGDINIRTFADEQDMHNNPYSSRKKGEVSDIDDVGYLGSMAQMLERCFILVSELER